MSTKNVTISLKNVENHSNIVKQCLPLFHLPDGTDTVDLKLDLSCDFIRSDFLLLITAAIRNLDEQGIKVTGEFIAENHNIGYAQRMNFFKSMNITHHEGFQRRYHEDRFLEITQIKEGDYSVVDRISSMLLKNSKLDTETVSILDLALGELVDNIRHSHSFNGGWAVSQYIEGLNQIRAIVADTGVGIYNSLTANEDYKNLTPFEALSMCINKGVTGNTSEGMGNGLYIASEFIKKNGGIMKIHSGNMHHSIARGNSFVTELDSWDGTYIYLQIDTNKPVKITEVMDDDSHYSYFLEKHGLEKLW